MRVAIVKQVYQASIFLLPSNSTPHLLPNGRVGLKFRFFRHFGKMLSYLGILPHARLGFGSLQFRLCQITEILDVLLQISEALGGVHYHRRGR